ncbi:aminodeoxychorismate/anthranilate synthase component II [Hymenobacter sp. RP-2-7]|uniref:Aminodeoxychorismate/anthranilate synthase component II n=1 Tax=Hymenobacter polaris TaxID=2682546 RepID=A0A7Y0AD70_9BACT|nr:aminodeoxychorismate/anthranilate synthase component II [Hymenobacter polaris]
MVCVVDNYDSFTYNIVHYLHELGAEVRVVLNDELSTPAVLALAPTHLVLSPGPGRPQDAGISRELLLAAARQGLPTLGICLGHELIGEAFGGCVKHARRVMHGKASPIQHTGRGLFVDIPQAFLAGRYHSLIVEPASLPECLAITAWTATPDKEVDEIMGLAHQELPIYGVQFHPESILTAHGHQLLSTFLKT